MHSLSFLGALGILFFSTLKTFAAPPYEVTASKPLDIRYAIGTGTVRAEVKPGTRLRLLWVEGDVLTIAFASTTAIIPKSSTDYAEASRNWAGIPPEQFFVAEQHGYLIPGMSRQQVEAIWGAPTSQRIEEGCDEWRYEIEGEEEREISRFEVSRGHPSSFYYLPGSVVATPHGYCQTPPVRVPAVLSESVVVSSSQPVKVVVGETVVGFDPAGLVRSVHDEWHSRRNRNR